MVDDDGSYSRFVSEFRRGWPIQAFFWLEWENSIAGERRAITRSRFLAVHSISTLPLQPSHSGGSCILIGYIALIIQHIFGRVLAPLAPTQAKTACGPPDGSGAV